MIESMSELCTCLLLMPLDAADLGRACGWVKTSEVLRKLRSTFAEV